jgi:hypothetical protein
MKPRLARTLRKSDLYTLIVIRPVRRLVAAISPVV